MDELLKDMKIRQLEDGRYVPGDVDGKIQAYWEYEFIVTFRGADYRFPIAFGLDGIASDKAKADIVSREMFRDLINLIAAKISKNDV